MILSLKTKFVTQVSITRLLLMDLQTYFHAIEVCEYLVNTSVTVQLNQNEFL